jgi:hypothetical protein
MNAELRPVREQPLGTVSKAVPSTPAHVQERKEPMTEPHTEVTVKKLPPCCICTKPAHYDAKTTIGPWGYLCSDHFAEHGIGLGLGLGQRLVVAP